MTITPSNLLKHELIGLNVRIEKSTSHSLESLTGKVIDESYSMLTIEAKSRSSKKGKGAKGKKAKKDAAEGLSTVEKVIPKSNSIFIFTLPNGVKVQVDGRLLVGRPEDRIKKRLVRW